MNEWIVRLRKLLEERSTRERWLMLAAGAVVVFLLVQLAIVSPLQTRRAQAQLRIDQLESQILQARRAAAEVRRLQGGVEAVQARIQASGKTDLLPLLDQLAARAAIKDRIDGIDPNPVSGNEAYPETRAVVKIRGATLEQAVRFLHSIEAADTLLIMRSVRINRARGRGETAVLDLDITVSSFERA